MALGERVIVWEDAYRRYQSSAGPNVVVTSRAVASAWRSILQVAELPWWLLAAVGSAAEAFERQAEEWEADAARARLATPPKRVLTILGAEQESDDSAEDAAPEIPRSRMPADPPVNPSSPDVVAPALFRQCAS